MPTQPLQQTFEEYLEKRSYRQRVEDALAALKTYKQHKLIPEMGDRERTIVAKFPGWGTLGRLFADATAPQWEQDARASLKEILSDDEYEECRNTILNAFPTSPYVIAAIWEFLRQIGWQGGKVLDPGCGTANFLTFCPEEMRAHITRYIGVEIEPITCGIAERLHPDGSFYPRSIENLLLPTNTVDLVIGNVPFEDGVGQKKGSFQLHGRCLLKSLELLKPGSLVLLITSTGLLDAKNRALRERVDQQALFLGAIRLPTQTHKGTSGTQCTSDLVLLQKRFGPEDDRHRFNWCSTEPSELRSKADNKPIYFSEFFHANPSYLLGTPVTDRTTFGDDFALDWKSDQSLFDALNQRLAEWATDLLTSNAFNQPTQEDTTMYATDNSIPDWQNGITIVGNDEKNGIEVRFPAKPPSAITERLKAEARFRYSDKGGDARWYAPQSRERWIWSKSFAQSLGFDIEIPIEYTSNFQAMSDEPMRQQPPQSVQPMETVVTQSAPEPIAPPTPAPAPKPAAPPAPTQTSGFVLDWDSLMSEVEAFVTHGFESFVESFVDPREVTARIKAAVDAQMAEYEANRLPRMSVFVWKNTFEHQVAMYGIAAGIGLWQISLEMQRAKAAEPAAKK